LQFRDDINDGTISKGARTRQQADGTHNSVKPLADSGADRQSSKALLWKETLAPADTAKKVQRGKLEQVNRQTYQSCQDPTTSKRPSTTIHFPFCEIETAVRILALEMHPRELWLEKGMETSASHINSLSRMRTGTVVKICFEKSTQCCDGA
jgi:hypothetical protein